MSRVVTDVNLSTGRIDYGEGGGGGATVNVGDTTTLPAGSNATVTNSGTETNVVLDFGIPRGADGATGADGDDGITPTVAVTAITGGHNVAFSYGTGDARNTDFDVMDGAEGQQGPAGADGTDAKLLIIESSCYEIAKATDGTRTPDYLSFYSYLVSGNGTRTPAVKTWRMYYSSDGETWSLWDTSSSAYNSYSKSIIGIPSTARFIKVETGVLSQYSWDPSARFVVPILNDGAKGDPGGGVPVGGTTGQYLVKHSNTDQDAEWITPSPRLGYDTINGVTYISIIED